jgi:hypothetical protein
MNAIDLVIDALKKNNGVTSKTTLSRIYPLRVPQQQTLDHIVVNIVSGNDEQMLGGNAGLNVSRVQVDCMSKTASGAIALGDAVIAALEKKPANAHQQLRDCYRDGIDASDFSDDSEFARRILGFYVHH